MAFLIVSLLLAFLDTIFGAYFVILKTRNERLWTDRYECLLKIIEISENIRLCHEEQAAISSPNEEVLQKQIAERVSLIKNSLF